MSQTYAYQDQEFDGKSMDYTQADLIFPRHTCDTYIKSTGDSVLSINDRMQKPSLVHPK